MLAGRALNPLGLINFFVLVWRLAGWGCQMGFCQLGFYRGDRPFYLVCPVLSTKKLISVSSALPLDALLPLLDEQIVEMPSHC